MSAQHTPGLWTPVYVKPEGASAHHWRAVNAAGEWLKRLDGEVWICTSESRMRAAIAKATGGAA